MLGREVVESQQRITILVQAFGRLVVLRSVALDECVECSLGASFCLSQLLSQPSRSPAERVWPLAAGSSAAWRARLRSCVPYADVGIRYIMPTSGLCRSSETNPVDIGVSAVITRHNPDLRTDHGVAVKASRMHSRNVMLSFRKHDGVRTTSKNKGLPATADAGQFGSRLPSQSCLDYADVAPLQSLV